jgi:hypothetical protein
MTSVRSPRPLPCLTKSADDLPAAAPPNVPADVPELTTGRPDRTRPSGPGTTGRMRVSIHAACDRIGPLSSGLSPLPTARARIERP